MSDPVARLNAALDGRYRIEAELGEGGMATVYLAEDLKHHRKVALKVLKPELAAVVGAERFLAEIKTTANLTHPHILPLFDSGEADGFLFYVMPYVEGETLRDRIDREKQLPVEEAVALASKVAGALQHAHEHGVIHRDIKPGNILLQDGEPVVGDFGIALAVGAAGSNRLTETGLSLGTPYYMSPEQATGDQVVGASTLAFALGFGWLLLRPQLPQSVAQFESPFREGQGPIFFGANGFDLSPDGAILVYRGPVEGAANRRVNRLWVRRWDDPDASSIRGTESASSPAVSPDGRQLAFQQGGQIRVLSFSGGPIRTLAAGNSPRWGPDGHIYFLASGQGSMRVPVTGGPPEPVTHVAEGEATHFVSDFLPGGEGALMHVIFSGGEWEIRALRFDTGEMTTLTPGRWPRYAASGHLTFRANNGSLMAAPFDPRAMEITGPVVPMIEDVTHFALSETGSLIYSTGQVGGDQNTELVWVTRIGATEPVDPGLQFDAGFGRPGSFGWKLSPDGGRVAVTRIVAGNTDIWIKQLPNGPFERLTLDAELEMSPFWSPDGQFVAYGRGAGPNSLSIWRSRSDGAGAPELWLRDAGGLQGRWSPDGAWMIFRTAAGTGLSGVDIVGFRPDQDSVATPLLATDFIEQGQALSPDGHWLAYSSNESGQTEVYVRPFPEVESGRAQVSTNGGSNPLWAHSGAELFYVNADLTMIAAQIETDSEFRVLAREVLFTLGPGIRNR